MTKISLYIFTILIGTFSFFSCDESEDLIDNDAPIVYDFKMDRHTAIIGDTVVMSYKFEDDVFLSSYKVVLQATFELEKDDSTHIAYDGVIHRGGFEYNEILKASKVDTLKMPRLGYSAEIKKNLSIAPGKYEVQVYCLDRKGNESAPAIETLYLYEETDE